MENKKLFSITGLFDTPDDIMNATDHIAKEGYKKYDVNTPYPIHGMDSAMKLKPSKLGYFALLFGLSGTAFALLFMYWVTSIDYPLVIGGKPFYSFPALIPITFEVTVLLASVGTVLTMLFLFFRLPNNSHPLHDTDYMKKVSVDKFGVSIEAKDKLFDEAKVKDLLLKLNAKNITEIYYDEEILQNKVKIYTPKFVIFLIFTFIFVSAISYWSLNKMLYQAPFNWMMNQPRDNPQSKSEFFADGFGMRMPVAGTISRGNLPYQFTGQPEQAEANLTNPLAPTKENLELGKRKFLTFCSPCHGNLAKGDSRLDNQFPNPPSLHSEKVRNWQDGRIFHIITEGQNIMPSYAVQTTKEERWAIVLYVRALQRALNATEEDVK
ncbi:MAG: quinol:electron acceptor oxidoreductase subunit ActD [FCB group bacterium]|jgi:mono/diheme cytochrome c family protein